MSKTPIPILQKIENARIANAEEIDLSDSYLIEFPKELLALKQLKSVKLSSSNSYSATYLLWTKWNYLRFIPDRIQELTALQYLDLRGNPLIQLPDTPALFIDYTTFQKENIMLNGEIFSVYA